MTTKPSRIAGFRERKDQHFRESPQSPLTDEQKSVFTSLAYFPENPDLHLVTELDTTGPGIGEEITVGTVSGEAKQYVRAGRVHFEVDGQPSTLTIFKSVDRGHYFLPFRDATAGEETYEVGRYLEPKALPDGRINVDFNLAYNPLCAYSTGWACPIPPFENVIKVPIRAGEMLPTFPKA